MIKSVEIKKKKIGPNYPTLIIAEMACAHQGIVENACELVKIAVESKADAIQLQVFKKENYMSPLYKDYELIKKLELSQDEWLEVIEKIKQNNIQFFAAGYDIESIRFLIENEVDAFKIHSSDISNPEILVEIGKSKKPVFLSTGASKIDEVKQAIGIVRKNGTKDIILMHGYQGFPTKIEETHLKYIKTLEKTLNLNVGFYDHVDGGSILAKIIPIMAIGYNAQVIEKHFILERDSKGIDYESSLDAKNFKEFIQLLRECEKAIGSDIKSDFTESEKQYRAYCKKSIIAKHDIPVGKVITKDDVLFMRSEPGIPPNLFKKIEGKIIKKEVKKYNNLNLEDF